MHVCVAATGAAAAAAAAAVATAVIMHLRSRCRHSPRPTSAKLYYWPATGRAETVRILLAEAGIPFENVCFEKPTSLQIYKDPQSFAKVKELDSAQAFFAHCRSMGGNLTNNLPMLEMNGRYYTQSTALFRLVARLAGLYPDDDAEAAYVVDNVLAHVEDMFTLPYAVLLKRPVPGCPSGLTLEAFKAEVMPKHLGNLERLLASAGGEYFTGSFGLADVRVFDVLIHLFERPVPGCLKPFPLLSSLVERLAARPCIAAYLASDEYAKLDKFQEFV
eukprot:1990165-Pleurochrysis_carterae.AAC.2